MKSETMSLSSVSRITINPSRLCPDEDVHSALIGESMKPRTAAQVFPPGEFIREEMEARGWTQKDLAAVLGRPLQAINEIVNGKKRITAQTAKELGAAFGTSADLWINLQTAYELANT